MHSEVKYLPALAGEPRRFLFVAMDRATRWVVIALKKDRTAPSAPAFLTALVQAAPFRIQKGLTDHGAEFTARGLRRELRPSGAHVFERAGGEQGIEQRLSPPRHPQTHGRVERGNGRSAEVRHTHHGASTEALETTRHRYADLYHHHIPQQALQHQSPVQSLKKWPSSHPQLLRKKGYHLTGLDR